MQQRIMIQKTDAIDRVFPLTEGKTEVFTLPSLSGGCFVRVYDTPERKTPFRCGQDFCIQDAETPAPRQGHVRLIAVPGGALEGAASVYVVTAGNTWQEEATVEVYGEEAQNG